jgi:hypothetical protein
MLNPNGLELNFPPQRNESKAANFAVIFHHSNDDNYIISKVTNEENETELETNPIE